MSPFVRSGVRTALGPLALALALCVHVPSALAQEMCPAEGGMVEPPNFGGLDSFFPSDHSVGIPLDGFVRLRYVGIAPAIPFVQVQDLTAGGTMVNGTIGVAGVEVHWFSAAPLQPSHQYSVSAIDPFAATTTQFSFTTGIGRTSGQPLQFAGATGISSDRNGTSDLCGDANAVTITLNWSRATSNGNGWPETEIEYVIYETRGPNIAGPVERVRERGRGTQASCPSGTDYCRAFRLTSDNASAPVCFNVQAMDPYGQPDGNAVEQCIDPSRGNFFNGCDARPPTPSRPSRTWIDVIAVGVLAVMTTLFVRGRRRSRR